MVHFEAKSLRVILALAPKIFFVPKCFSGHFQLVLSKSLVLRFFCRFVGKNATKFLCYIDLLKVTKLTRLAGTKDFVGWKEGQQPYFLGPWILPLISTMPMTKIRTMLFMSLEAFVLLGLSAFYPHLQPQEVENIGKNLLLFSRAFLDNS